MVKVALGADRVHRLLERGTGIEKRCCIFSEPIVCVGEVAIVTGMVPLLCNAPLHQGKIPLMLCADASGGIPHMADRESDRLMIEYRCAALLDKRLMHTPLIRKPSSKTQEANMRRAPHLLIPRILIHMHNRKQYSIHMRHHNIDHRKIGTDLRRRKKSLIRVENGCPVRICPSDHRIACGSKVVLPREIKDLSPRFLRKRTGTVRRAGVCDNAFIGINRCIRKPDLHILHIVAHKDTCRNAHLLRMRINAPPDLHAAAQFSGHLLREERNLYARMRSRGQRMLCRSSSFRIAVMRSECLGVLRMHLRQLRKYTCSRLCNVKIFLSEDRICAINTQENPPAAARIDNAAPPKPDVETGIVFRHSFIAEVVIGLGKITPAALRCIRIIHLLVQKAQIALPLCT